MDTLNLKTGLISKTQPEVIVDLKNGQSDFLYNHNIQKQLVIVDEEGNETVTTDANKANGERFQYDSLRVGYPHTAKNIYGTLLEEVYPTEQQQKLLNDYQSAELGILDDVGQADAAIDAYKAFLKARKDMKAAVYADAEANNIPVDL